MKTSILALSAFLSSLVVAQYQGVPPCARDCVASSLPMRCNGDVECICSDASFISGVSCCISGVCSLADQQTALDTARGLCSGSNVQLPSAAGCANGASPSSTSGGAAASTSSTSAGSSSAATSTSTSSSASSGSPSSTTSSASAASTTPPNPGNKLAVNGMGLAGALFGAVALL